MLPQRKHATWLASALSACNRLEMETKLMISLEASFEKAIKSPLSLHKNSTAGG